MAEAHKDKLLQGRADHGELRGGIAVSKFQAAAKKVLVTNEVCLQHHSAVERAHATAEQAQSHCGACRRATQTPNAV